MDTQRPRDRPKEHRPKAHCEDRRGDRREIEDCQLRYVRGVDRKGWDLVRAAYHTEAHDGHGNYKGGIDGFVDSLIARRELGLR